MEVSDRQYQEEADLFALDARDEERRPAIMEILDECRHWWEARGEFRTRRKRSRDYYRGKQWDELITDPDNPDATVAEKTVIERQGRIPWVMNHVGAAVRNMKGQFRQNRSDRAVFAVNREDTEATEAMNVALRGVRRYNKAPTVEADQFEEHVLSGSCAWRAGIEYDTRVNRDEVRMHPVDQTRLFFNLDVRDRRLEGIRLVGELHDLTMEQLLVQFAHDEEGNYSPKIADKIRKIYAQQRSLHYDSISDYGNDHTDRLSFWDTFDASLNRVVEVWKKEHTMVAFAHDPVTGDYAEFNGDDAAVAQVNAEREATGLPEIEISARYEPVWTCYFLSPFGDVLYEAKNPYWHEDHPYTIGLSTLVDGDTWGMVEQIIDPQRWMNRLVATMDHSLSAAAKGVLLVPEDAIPDDMDIADFAETWSRANGVLKIKVKPGSTVPTQVSTSAISNESFTMLENLKTWIQEVSGITGPIQGFNPKSGTPASLYQQQVIQASTTNLDYFESFLEALQAGDRKVVQLIMQAYDESPRFIREGSQGMIQYDPAKVRDIDFDVATGNVADTATYRQLAEEDLRTFLDGGYIDFFTYLEMSSHPKADALLQILQTQQNELGGMDVGMMTQAMAQQQGQLPA